MSDASLVKIVVHGAPHPLTRAAFRYLAAIAEAAGGIEVELITVARDPLMIGGEQGIYLRSNALDTLPLQRLERPDAPLAAIVATALLRRLDVRWRDLPTLNLVETLQDPTLALEFLAETAGITIDARIIAAARVAFRQFKGAEAAYGEPFAYIGALETEGAEDELVMQTGRIHATFACESGVPALIEGWMAPDMDGCWLVRQRSSLRLYFREPAVLLTLAFSALPDGVAFKALVNGLPSEPLFRHEEGVSLMLVPLLAADKSTITRSFSIDLLLNRPEVIEESGIKLRAIRLDPLPARGKNLPLVAEPWALTNHGFVARPVRYSGVSTTRFLPPLSAQHLLDRADERTLIVAGATDGLGSDLLQPSVGLIAASAWAEPNDGGGDPTPFALIAGSMAEFPEMPATIDRIHLHRIAESFEPQALLAWATAQLSYRGLLSGAEESAKATIQLVSALTRAEGGRELTFLIEDASWMAAPMAFWKR